MELPKLILIVLLCQLLKESEAEVHLIYSPCIGLQHATSILHTKPIKFLGTRIPYYSNASATFQLRLLECGDVQPNPGPFKQHRQMNDTSHRDFVVDETKSVLTYDKCSLMKYNDVSKGSPLQVVQQDILDYINILGISRKPSRKHRSHRGKRGGRRKQRHIPVFISSTSPKRIHVTRGIVKKNLIPIQRFDPSNISDIKVCLWNAHSIRNKTFLLHDYISEHDLDLMMITETWLREGDSAIINECTPPGYTLLSIPRLTDHHGGIAALFKSHLNLNVHHMDEDQLKFNTFEHAHVVYGHRAGNTHIFIIYRPPPSASNRLRVSDFLAEFETLVNEISILSGHVMIVGDFNLHIDEPSKPEVRQFLSIIDTGSMVQHVHGATHKFGHTLDLVISRNLMNPTRSVLHDDQNNPTVDCQIRDLTIHENFLSDHHCVRFLYSLPETPVVKRVRRNVRKFKDIEPESFSSMLRDILMTLPDSCDANVLLQAYTSAVTECLDNHAPMKVCVQSTRVRNPWFNEDILAARRSRRQAERKWKKHRSDANRKLFADANRCVHNAVVQAKRLFLEDKLTDADTKTVFNTLNSLLNRDRKPLPSEESSTSLVTRFKDFFVDKIVKIRESLDNSDPSAPEHCFESDRESSFSAFEPVSEENLEKIIRKMSNSSCSLDPEPTWLLKKYAACHVPALTRIVNASFQSGVFPAIAHQAIVTPVLKKPSLDSQDIKNYRPVSNLTFVAKVIEKAAASQFVEHLTTNELYDPMQSAYRIHFSTETALLKLQNDILAQFDKRKAVFLVLLDLSAAFDTVDHEILLKRLESNFQVSDIALRWMHSYLTGWTSRVKIMEQLSEPWTCEYGVPQGSVMGPLLYSVYITPVSDIIQKHNLSYLIYADDIQLYAPFDPRSTVSMQEVLQRISLCILDISKWMTRNFLKLNVSKTEFIALCPSNRYANNLYGVRLAVGDKTIVLSSRVMNLGICIDSNFTLASHVNNLVRTCNFHLKNLWRVRRFIDVKTCHHAVRALILSRIDYCNSLFVVLSSKHKRKLESIQNRAARLVFQVGRRVQVSPLFQELHWLPFSQRVQFKLCLYVYKLINNTAPSYLADTIAPYLPTRNLRSTTDSTRLAIPRSNLSSAEKRFSVSASRAWNNLPPSIRAIDTLLAFKRRLKTYLFPQS